MSLGLSENPTDLWDAKDGCFRFLMDETIRWIPEG